MFPHIAKWGSCSCIIGCTRGKSSDGVGWRKGMDESTPPSKGTPGAIKRNLEEWGRGLWVTVSGYVFKNGLSSFLASSCGEFPPLWAACPTCISLKYPPLKSVGSSLSSLFALHLTPSLSLQPFYPVREPEPPYLWTSLGLQNGSCPLSVKSG